MRVGVVLLLLALAAVGVAAAAGNGGGGSALYQRLRASSTDSPSRSLSAVDWAHQTAASLAALAASEFTSLTRAELASIPTPACTGFQQAQLLATGSNPGSDVCSGFTPACFANIGQDVMTGLSNPCAMSLAPAVIASFQTAQISKLPIAACSVLNATQVAAFNSKSPKTQCQYLPGNCLSSFALQAMPGFTAACINNIYAPMLAQFTATQIGALSVGGIAGLNSNNIQLLTDSCAGFTATQFAVMPTNLFYNWAPGCAAAFTPAGLGGWNRAQMRSFTPSYFWAWSLAQISGLSPLGASGISPYAAKWFPDAKCVAFKAPQIALFRDFYTQHVCEQWSPGCLANIPASEYKGFSQGCMTRLRLDTLAAVTGAQMSNVLATTFAVLVPEQVASLTPSAVSGITANQMRLFDQAFPATGCTGFGANFKALPPMAVQAITPQCASHISKQAFQVATEEQMAVMPFAFLSRDTITVLVPEQCAKLSGEQVASMGVGVFPHDAVLGLSKACLAALPADTCGALTSTFMEAYDKADAATQKQLLGLSPSCLQALPATACAAATAPFFDNIEWRSCGSFTPACFGALTAAGAAGLSTECLSFLPAASFAALPEAAFGALSPAVWKEMSSAAVKALTEQQCAWITPTQANALADGGNIKDLTASCLAQLQPTTCAGANKSFLSKLDSSICPSFSSECMAAISSAAAAGFSSECVLSVPAAAFNKLSAGAFAGLSTDVFAAMDAQVVGAMALQHCAAVTGAQLNSLTAEATAAFQAQCVGKFNADACGGVSSSFLKSVSVPSCAGYLSPCFARISAAAAPGFSGACIHEVPLVSFAALQAPAFAALSNDVFSQMTRETTSVLSAEQCAVISGDALNALEGDAPLGMSPACLGALSKESCASTGARFWSSFNASDASLDLLSSVDAACVSALDCALVDTLPEQVLAHFNGTSGTDLRRACEASASNGPSHTVRNVLIGVACGLFVLLVVVFVWRRRSANEHAKRNGLTLDHEYMQQPEDM